MQEQAIIKKKDKIGRVAQNPAVNQLFTKQVDEKLIEHLQDSGRKKIRTSEPANYATFGGTNFQTKKTAQQKLQCSYERCVGDDGFKCFF